MHSLVELAREYKRKNYPDNNRTIVSDNKLESIVYLCEEFGHIPGDIAEVGVWRGGVGILFGEFFKRTCKRVYLFDTFEGIPYSGSNDNVHKFGDFGPNDGNYFVDYNEVCES